MSHLTEEIIFCIITEREAFFCANVQNEGIEWICFNFFPYKYKCSPVTAKSVFRSKPLENNLNVYLRECSVVLWS